MSVRGPSGASRASRVDAAVDEALVREPNGVAPGSLFQVLTDFHLAPPEELDRISSLRRELESRAEMEVYLEGLLVGGARPSRAARALLEDHRARLSRGEPYGGELIRLARALPRGARDTGETLRPGDVERVAALVPPERRGEMLEALVALGRLSAGRVEP